MNLLHVVSSISRRGAGVAKAVRDLSRLQAEAGHQVTIVTLEDAHTAADRPELPGVRVVAARTTLLESFGFAGSLSRDLRSCSHSAQLIHLHGLWMYPNWVAGSQARRRAVPYVMSPHGMLEPWGLARSSLKKRAVAHLFENRNIAKASCLHACSAQEADNFRRYGYRGAVAVVPLGLLDEELAAASRAAGPAPRPAAAGSRKIALFLSRLHEKKGAHLLVEVWGELAQRYPDWQLVFAGDGDPSYLAGLQRQVRDAGLADSVTFMGAVYGEQKWDLLRSASLFVLPTSSENFGLVVAEALSAAVPVITTKGAPWQDLTSYHCGWWIETGREPLSDALRHALSLPEPELRAMGCNGRQLISSRYAMTGLAKKFEETYRWVVGEAAAPAWVRMG